MVKPQLKKLYFYYLKLENTSPVHVGNGKEEQTDNDLITTSGVPDWQECFFIPGTSVAGVCFHALDDNERKIIDPTYEIVIRKEKLSGYKQSPVFFSDMFMTENKVIESRDGVQLDADKLASSTGKYDYQIVPKGCTFELRMEVKQYSNDNANYDEIIHHIMNLIQSNDIVFGYKTTRGLGKFKINSYKKKTFCAENMKEYFDFNKLDYEDRLYGNELKVEAQPSEKYFVLNLDLKQVGGLSIRTYGVDKNEPDSVQLESGGNPVIPGSSWNGMIRSRFEYYASLMDSSSLVEYVFGSKNKKSQVIIEESVFNDGKKITMVRNKIDRFSNAPVDRALFKERALYSGTTNLIIRIPNNICRYQQVLDIFKNIIKDIHEGYIAVGGETSIGRGLFEVNNIADISKQIECEITKEQGDA